MAMPDQTAPIERRDGSRYTCEDFNNLTILVRSRMQKHQVVVFNISATGIAFIMDVPLKPGEVVAFQRYILAPGQSWIRSGKVNQATKRGDKWLIGCELTPPFSAEELNAIR
jgi:PilZ domain